MSHPQPFPKRREPYPVWQNQADMAPSPLERAGRGVEHVALLKEVLESLKKEGRLPEKYKQHPLKSNYKGRMECQIKPDWLLIWKQDDQNEIISRNPKPATRNPQRKKKTNPLAI